MRWLVDLIYLILAVLTAPVWLIRMSRTGKIKTDWKARFGKTASLPPRIRPRILFHAVSVGEVNAIRLLVEGLAVSESSPELVIAATTDTGYARAKELWGSRHLVVRYPFDFSFAVGRFLRAIQPNVAVLVELELWPNFTAMCVRRGIPIAVVNGRLTERSYKRYQMVAGLVRPMFRRMSAAAVQNQAYADRFIALGTDARSVQVTGTMKWDTAQVADHVAGADELAIELGIDRTRPLIVAGSTAPEEHAMLHAAVPMGVQLLCAPRKPEWFDDAERQFPGCVRRTRVHGTIGVKSAERYLLDTIGELRKAYALADLVIVGRSFGSLHGSDMMEPVALGKPTIVGPAVTDFQDTVDALLAGDGLMQTSEEQLPSVIQSLLNNRERCRQLAHNGRAVIRANQGATQRHIEIILKLLETSGH